MKLVTTVRDLRLATASWRRHEETLGFVPTMGALHAGHLSLIKRAQNLTGRTMASIFVNPLQFSSANDTKKYPRTIEADQQALSDAGCDLLFMPSVEEMYTEGFSTKVEPGPWADPMEGEHRPGHFVGVATVVTKLLLQTMPDYAFFGEKDYQQLCVIQHTVNDLNIPVIIVPVATVRDHDGLALSTRNTLLSAAERERATVLPETLFDAAERLRAGEDIAMTLEGARMRLREAGFKLDYLELSDGRTLAPLTATNKFSRLFVAATLGTTRLIDNVALFDAGG